MLQLRIGIDAGSTTLKFVVLNDRNEIIYKSYRRHKAEIRQMFREELNAISRRFVQATFSVAVTGSAGLGIAEQTGLPFVQEVIAAVNLKKKLYPYAKTLLDIGGEDAKIVFLADNKRPDIRMNGSCAGGTGAFIDQMASLLNIQTEQLGIEALRYGKIYPVASRCGVFAKTDIQNLISRHVTLPDIAASALHAVALQTLTSLAHGCEIVAPVLCTGGPLTFIPALRDRFCEILQLSSKDFFVPDNSEFFSALGAALYAGEKSQSFDLEALLKNQANNSVEYSAGLPALFGSKKEYEAWKQNRNIKPLSFTALENVEGPLFLGIDSGSTTTKITVIDDKQRIVFKYYANNDGDSLQRAIEGLKEFYCKAEAKKIVTSAVTGYGEDLIRSALGIDYGIVETMAHLTGAQFIDPLVSFVLDIGGQDMKSIFVNNGVISNIELNEACSSGCGSFLQNFASTIQLNLEDFSNMACLSKHPSDLGSRCTVFMNSKVKQSLRDHAGIDDIAAGLAYSVVKNCLFKVLKISNLNMLGEHLVVQGGTFRNDAVYRALELISGKSVSATDHPELMGAFGAALFAYKMYDRYQHSGTEVHSGLDNITATTSEVQCKGCANRCAVVKMIFTNGNVCYAGNKCEKVFFNKHSIPAKGLNAFEKKNKLLFDQSPTSPSPHNIPFPPSKGERGKGGNHNSECRTIGIPRVLNMFDDFPFWNALFAACGFEVVLSPESTVALFQKGIGSVMSDNICFPAKLVHGHIVALLEQKPERLFYPLIPKTEKEFSNTSNSFNCPVVSGYPDVIRSSIDPEGKYGIPFDTPVIGFNSEKTLKKTCWRYFSGIGVAKQTFDTAFRLALGVRNNTTKQLVEYQNDILQKAIRDHSMVFIVAGRPYHTDPLIHQKTGQILSDLGVITLTDDVFRNLPLTTGNDFSNLNFVSQWSYPNRVIQTALQVAQLPRNVQMVQLNSFGCGPDSFLMDEASEILKKAGKHLTVIRIDEITSPGSTRLRLRSLVESLKASSQSTPASNYNYKGYRATFDKQDWQKTILIPWFSDFISPFLPAIGKLSGYTFVNLPPSDRTSAEVGLKYGHNEVCYPSTLVLGDIIKTLQSNKYDLGKTAVAITQTGGQCRATNYIAQIKTGLTRAGYEDIPVISLATGQSIQNEQKGFSLPWRKLLNIVAYAVLYGDGLFQMYNATAVREKTKGHARKLFDFYMSNGSACVARNDARSLLQLLEQAVADFNLIPVQTCEFTKIGLIGEIFVKYNNYAQAFISEWLREKNMEVITPPIIDFIMQYFVNIQVNNTHGIESVSLVEKMIQPVFRNYMNKRIQKAEAILKDFRYYIPCESIFTKARFAEDILHLSNQFGEGWMIPAEIATYARKGIEKVVCIQPFGCIANHIVAKGIEKRLKKFYPNLELLYLDIDSGIAEVNLQNRLHFLME